MGSPGPPASLPAAPQPRYYALHATHYTLHTTHYSLHTKEPQSRLSRRNRERIDPEQVQSSPAVHSPLSVTRETESQRRERHRRKLRRGPRVGWDWFSFSFPSILPSYSNASLLWCCWGGPPCSGTSHDSLFLYVSLITRKRRQREEGEGQSQPEEPRETEEGDAQTEAPERPQSLISSLLRVTGDRERKEGARASQRSPGGQRRERLRRKLRRGPGVGWDWFSNSFPLVFLAEPIREPTK